MNEATENLRAIRDGLNPTECRDRDTAIRLAHEAHLLRQEMFDRDAYPWDEAYESRFPWDQWLDGRAWRVDPFDARDGRFRPAAHSAAEARGVVVRFVEIDGRTYFGAVPA